MKLLLNDNDFIYLIFSHIDSAGVSFNYFRNYVLSDYIIYDNEKNRRTKKIKRKTKPNEGDFKASK